MADETKFITGDCPQGRYATLDGYDGAPDASGIYSFIATGRTDEEAIEDLKEMIESYEERETA